MAVLVTETNVKSFALDYLDVTWTIANTTDDLTQFRFTVNRSESPEGPYQAVSPPLQDKYVFRDRTVDLAAKWRVFFYQVVARHVTNLVPETLGPINFLGTPPDLEAIEIMRLFELTLKTQIGRVALLFKRRTFGQNCPECFDDIRNRKDNSQCTTCFSSKYRGGFFKPIATYFNFTPSYKTIRLAAFHDIKPSETVVEMSGYPVVGINDIVVEDSNRRWRVQDVRERSKRRFVYRQICRLMEIPRREVEYKLAVDSGMFVLPYAGEDILIFERNTRQGL